MSNPTDACDSLEEDETSLRLGAAVSLEQGLPYLAALCAELADIIQGFGSFGSGTIGSDLANFSLFEKFAPCLIALKACVDLRSGNERRVLPLDDFFSQQDLHRDELLESLTIPKLGANEYFRAYRVQTHSDEESSTALGAFKFDIRGGRVASARIVFGGLTEKPTRAATTEAFAVGLRIADEETWRGALDALALDFPPIVNQRAAATSRALVARDLLLQTLLELRGATVPAVS